MQLYLIIALVFSLLVAVFAIQNTEVVVIKFLTFSSSVSLVLVILGSAVVGALSLFFLSLFRQVSSWMAIRQLKQQKEELENRIKNLEGRLSILETTKAPAIPEQAAAANTPETTDDQAKII